MNPQIDASYVDLRQKIFMLLNDHKIYAAYHIINKCITSVCIDDKKYKYMITQKSKVELAMGNPELAYQTMSKLFELHYDIKKDSNKYIYYYRIAKENKHLNENIYYDDFYDYLKNKYGKKIE